MPIDTDPDSGDRLAFLCSWLLEFFLDPKPCLESEADQLQVTLDVLLQKLAEEIERLREICEQGSYLSLHEIPKVPDLRGRRQVILSLAGPSKTIKLLFYD